MGENMKRVKINMENFPRKAHFEYFTSMSNPYLGITADVVVDKLADYCKKTKRSFYLAFMHCAALAADEIPELRRRIIDGELWEYDECPTSHVELLEDETYCYCTLYHHMPDEEYFEKAEEARKRAREAATIEEEDEVAGMYFVTCIPWLHYSQLSQPLGGDSNVRISWGKYEKDFKGERVMPVTLVVHHGMVDGIQVGLFFKKLEEQLERMCESVAVNQVF